MSSSLGNFYSFFFQVKEQRMIQTVIQLLRGGKLDEAQQYVVNLGHAWLAAILEGLRYYYDPLCDGPLSFCFFLIKTKSFC
jgi:hypothetical protein